MKAIFCVTVVSILLLNTCPAAFGQSQKEVLSRVLSLNILVLTKTVLSFSTNASPRWTIFATFC
jgi:hypothetical protein